jgi:heptosyltransferase I
LSVETVGERVCIVLLTGLGDVVMGLPLANALKAQDRSRRITWVAEPMPAGALANHPAVDDVVVYRKRDGLRGIAALRRDLRAREIDLTLNLQIYFKSVWPTALSGAPERIGFGRDRARDGVWLFSNRRLPPRPRRHTADMFLEFAEHLGIHAPPIEWGLTLSEAEREEQRRFFEPLRDRPIVAIVPASGMAPKDWLPGRFAALIDALEHDYGFRTMLVGGPGERERRLAREITDRASAAPIQAMGDSVRRLIWLIGGSDLVIAPDTGPVHVARAWDVPVIGLYGHTNPYRVGPYRAYEDLWIDRYTDPGDEPDPSRFDPKDRRMEEITVADVLARVDRARERYGVAGGHARR